MITATARALKNMFRSTPNPPASKKPRRWLKTNAAAKSGRDRKQQIDHAVAITNKL
jgi:hypothetical protein